MKIKTVILSALIVSCLAPQYSHAGFHHAIRNFNHKVRHDILNTNRTDNSKVRKSANIVTGHGAAYRGNR